MSSEAEEFEKFLILEMQKEIRVITKDAEKLLKKNVQSELYDAYTPKVYQRTNELKNAITSTIGFNEGIAYFDNNLMNHTNAYGDDVGMFVPKWTDMGHKNNNGVDNMYNNYPARNYVDKTIKQLEEKYGKNCVEKIDSI
jgi:calcineurin-like phosphoesterase